MKNYKQARPITDNSNDVFGVRRTRTGYTGSTAFAAEALKPDVEKIHGPADVVRLPNGTYGVQLKK